MKRKVIEKIQDILVIVINHLLFVAGAITVLDFFHVNSPKLLLWIGMIIVPLLFYHFVKSPPNLIHPAMFIISLGGLSIAESKLSANDWSTYYYVIAFIYFVGYFIYVFISQFLRFWLLNQSTASNIPTKKIFRSGLGQTIVYAICSAVILFLSAKIEWVKAIVNYVRNGILAILRAMSSGESVPDATESTMRPDAGMYGNLAGEMISEDPHYFLRTLVFFLIVFAIASGVVFFAHLVYYLIKDIDFFKKRIKRNDILEDNEDVREYCGVEKKSTKTVPVFWFRNNREKIRRLYQKKIGKRKKELIGEQEEALLRYLTAKECCDKLSEQQLRTVYEKARYSEEVISAEDVRLAK